MRAVLSVGGISLSKWEAEHSHYTHMPSARHYYAFIKQYLSDFCSMQQHAVAL